MEDSSKTQYVKEFFRSIITVVESIYDNITELFGEQSSEDGLFSTRSSLLHQFAILASAYHQLNTLDFLSNDSVMSSIFSKELNIANYRTRDYEHRALDQIRENQKDMQEYLDMIFDVSEEILALQQDSESQIRQITNSYYENLIQSLLFYLLEINTRILEPAGIIIYAEMNASSKLLQTIEDKLNKSKDISAEAIARMCEVMSWGLESPPGWKTIQNDTSELTGNLEKNIGSLKALSTFYRS